MPVATSAQVTTTALDHKSATFQAHQEGDCFMEGGATLTLYSDGSLLWECDISSGDSGDTWKHRFRVQNGQGVVLYETSNYSFAISDKNLKKRWRDHRGANSEYATHYNEAASVAIIDCDC